MPQRAITIVGAGQSGLQLALGLQHHGYDVRVIHNRTPEEVRTGRVLSSQCMFDSALRHERDLGLAFWEGACPPIASIDFAVPAPDGSGAKAIDWNRMLDQPAQSVDQRVKLSGWMDEFERRGGRITIKEACVADLEAAVKESDLVIVAAGKGEVAHLFERDAARSPFAAPQRALALSYVTGMTRRPGHSAVCFNLIPSVGEYFVLPALTTTGPCEIMVFEGIMGGPMDCWRGVRTPEEHLARSIGILETFLPWEAERSRASELTDANGILTGAIAPVVRHPVGQLPSGRLVMGMADAVVLNDPITGQGSNNAAKCAAVYLDSVLRRGSRVFDADWMRSTFDTYWAYAQYVTDWTNALLQPTAPHILKLMVAAGDHPTLAWRIANGFDNPLDLFPWFMVPEEAEGYLQHLAAG